jgi:hypothetical protein
MSNIVLQPNASGTGSITIATPNTNTDRILNIPDVAGNLVTTGDTGTVTSGMVAGINTSALPSGTVVGSAMQSNSTAYTTTSGARYTVASVSYTPKFSSTESDIYLFGVVAHGIGPKETNLDTYGLSVNLEINGSATGTGQYADVFTGQTPTGASGISYGPEWDIRTCTLNYKNYNSWSAGVATVYGIYADNDGTGGMFVNRCAANATNRGTSSIHVLEVLK